MFGTSKNFVDGVTRHWVLGEVFVIRRGLKKAVVRLVASHRKRLEEFSPAEWLVLAIDLRLNDVKPEGFYLQTVTEDGPLRITRAKKRAVIMGTKEALGTALERKLNRDTGIAMGIPR